jgi:general secretion pathway protein L
VVEPLRRIIAAFFSWWFGELAACMPQGVRRALLGSSRRLEIIWLGREMALRWSARRDGRDLGRLPVDGEDAILARAEFRRLVAGLPLERSEIVVRLPAESVLQRTVDLPLAATENLREVLGFEMDRLTPFRAETVAYDCRVVSIDRDAKRARISLAVAPRMLLSDITELASRLGLAPDRIESPSRVDGLAEPFAFALPDVAKPGNDRWRAAAAALAAVSILFLVLAVWLPLERKRSIVAAYEARIAELRPEAQAVADLHDRIKASAERGSFVARHRLELPLAVMVLKDITDRLADDSWLLQFRLADTELTLVGYAPSTASLVPVLEASPALTDVRFSAPVTPDPTVGKERFGIVAKVGGHDGP